MAGPKALAAFYDVGTPLVFAHRGASATAPMNTLAAFQRALDLGADGIELDVWLSSDDVPVVIHDASVNATTDGEGRVGQMSLADLKALDAGAWFGPAFAGERIPTLDEVFEAVGRHLLVNVEVKWVDLDARRVVDRVLSVIRRHGMHERVLVSSFNPMVLRAMRRQAPQLPLGRLHAPELPGYIRWLTMGVRAEADHPQQDTVTEAFVRQAHRRGQRVNAWTVNDAERAQVLAGWGVDGLITDVPDVIRAAVGRV